MSKVVTYKTSKGTFWEVDCNSVIRGVKEKVTLFLPRRSKYYRLSRKILSQKREGMPSPARLVLTEDGAFGLLFELLSYRPHAGRNRRVISVERWNFVRREEV